MGKLSHLDDTGAARMVDISGKEASKRVAIAAATVLVNAGTLETVRTHAARKGDVLGVARVAGITGAKKTPDLIPLCHPISLTSVEVDFTLDDEPPSIGIRARAESTGPTGVEMEAMTAAAIAALTIYDMVKSSDRSAEIRQVSLVYKDGGKSGVYERRQ